MLPENPFFYILLALLLGFFFYVYLFLRRIFGGFREGFDRGRN